MNVLVLGSGGREHALAWKIKQSRDCMNIFVAPGNGGTSIIAKNLPVDINDFAAVKKIVIEHEIDMLVVGPEEPLVNGITDYFLSDKELKNLLVIGPDSEGAKLEGSKHFAKQFMRKYNIPTAAAKVFSLVTLKEGYNFLESLKPPYVLKADGLAAGKGVIITENLDQAKKSLSELLNGKFGRASQSVLIEEFLSGIELSVFVLTDGESYVILPEAKDYKRIGENDTGLNTGGMGAISPVGFADNEFMQKVENQIIRPTIEGIKKEGFNYKGFVFIGLIKVNNDPFVIEYNVRMGDPETEVVLPRIKSDLLPTLVAVAKKTLKDQKLVIEKFTASTVVLVSQGYPEPYEKGRSIAIGDKIDKVEIFHAGTILESGILKTNGGRVIAITGIGKNLTEALDISYEGVKRISWQGMNYRKDIGFDLKRLGQ